MEFKFNALSQDPDRAAEAKEEGKLFAMEMAAEGGVAAIGEPAQSPGSAEPAPAPMVEPEGEASEDGTSAAAAEESPEEAEIPVGAAGDAAADDKSEDKTGDKIVEDPEQAKDAAALGALMQLAAGKVTGAEVKLDVARPKVSSSPFQALAAAKHLDPESEHALDDLVSTLSDISPESGMAAGSGQAAFRQQEPSGPAVAARPGAVQMMPAGGGANQLGELAGRAIAGAVTAPFVALSSAARHLTNHFKPPAGAIPQVPAHAGSSLQGSRAAPLLNTLETITDWKCERIEKAALAVEAASAGIRAVEEFASWEDDVMKAAGTRGCDPADIVRDMHADAELAPLKEKMDRLWEAHPDAVSAFRGACDDFERNIRNVVKEFPNSEEQIKERVTKSMKKVEEDTKMLPGFGDKIGEYAKGLSERVRDLAKSITDFVQGLMRRLGGKTRTSDLSMP